MNTTMKAVRIHAFGGPDMLTVEERPVPQAGPGEVLIRIDAAAVNYADVVRRRNGPYPHTTQLPATLGIEVAGTIVALGDGVQGWAPGAPVFAVLPNALGGYAQYAVAPAATVVPVPAGMDADVACTLVVSGVTALQMLRDVARLQPGETVFIPAAAGGVGGYALQVARLLGAGRIIAAGGTKERRADAIRLGATDTVDSGLANWSEHVLALTDGRGADVVLEMVGGPFFDQSLAALAPFGRLVVYGQVGETAAQLDPLVLQGRNQSVAGYYVGGWFAGRREEAVEALKALVGHVLSGRLQVQIGHALPLHQASEAHRLIEARQARGKIVLKPWL